MKEPKLTKAVTLRTIKDRKKFKRSRKGVIMKVDTYRDGRVHFTAINSGKSFTAKPSLIVFPVKN